MKIDFKEIWAKIKEFWAKQSKKAKRLILGITGGVFFLIILLVVLLNIAGSSMRVLFPGMTSDESAQVYATLQEMGVQPEVDSRGQLLVPADRWDDLVFQLNAKGYPKTTLSYDTFTSSTGFTSTEFEKRTALVFEAQDRMQQTLQRQTGIEDAVVTFTVPETSNYIWDQANQEKSTCGVTVRMKPGYELSPERVSAIKHLAATAVPKLTEEDVVVVDQATGIEMPGLDDPAAEGYYSVQRLDYERLIAQQLEENARRILTPIYGSEGVTAVATVVLDYDKMITESKQYEAANPNGNTGVQNHYEEDYTLDGRVSLGGIVGEEDNTDAPPIYPNEDGEGGDASATNYHRLIDYDVSYIMTQIEKGEPLLQRATIAVVVDDDNFTLDTEETLTRMVSRATNISTDNVSVTNISFGQNQQPDQPTTPGGLNQRQRLILLLGGALLLLILILLIVILVLRARRKRKKAEEEAAAAAAAAAALPTKEDIEREIEEHKRQLQNEALASANSKENAITEEIRNFAKENPEITAALLRSMLREDQ